MHSFWQQIPFVRLLIPFLVGIVMNNSIHIPLWQTFILLMLTGIIYLFHSHYSKKILSNFLSGIILSIGFIFLGILNQQLHFERLTFNHYRNSQSSSFLVQVDEKPQSTQWGSKAICHVLSGVSSNGSVHKLQGKLLLNIKNNPQGNSPAYGDVLLIKSGLQEFPPASYPGAFDYRNYMKHKGVFFQTYAYPNNWMNMGLNLGKDYLKTIYGWQKHIQTALKNHLKSKGEIAISEALLYGYDKDMDEETVAAYSRTGTLHVLAVSGMHVGLIFVLLGWILHPIGAKPQGEKYVAILQTIGIWIYSLLCGMSPSILRASVMFSFVIIGKQIKRNSNPLNSLAASAMFLLWFDPNMLYHVGFQLSYMAVAGILGFYNMLYQSITFRYRLVDEIWKILAVSLASQILTLPLTLYYFHQFPNYFLVANLLIIPLTSLIIYGGILLLTFQWWSLLAKLFGSIMGYLIFACNAVAQGISNLPGAVISNIFWDRLDVFVYLLALWCLISFFAFRNIAAIKTLVVVFLGKLAILLYFHLGLNTQQALHVFGSQKSVVIVNKKGACGQIFMSKLSPPDSLSLVEKINQYAGFYAIRSSHLHTLPQGNTLLRQNGLNLFIWQEKSIPENLKNCIVLIQGKQYAKLPKFLQHNQIKHVILGGDLPRKKKTALKKILTKHHIPFHDLSENGAYELSL